MQLFICMTSKKVSVSVYSRMYTAIKLLNGNWKVDLKRGGRFVVAYRSDAVKMIVSYVGKE